ncbi:MAG: zinc ribbon domain-containing protein [Clostridia bacterium]|nr:zinc ribbon domain-containing protein [Clostridia bacterium]
MYCPNCGRQLPDTARFCDVCGFRIPQAAPSAPVSAEPFRTEPAKDPEKETKAPKKRSPVLGIFLILCAVLYFTARVLYFEAAMEFRLPFRVIFTGRGFFFMDFLPVMFLPALGMLLIGLYGVIQYPKRKYPSLAAIGALLYVAEPFGQISRRFFAAYQPYRFMSWQIPALLILFLLLLMALDCFLYRRPVVPAILTCALMLPLPIWAWLSYNHVPLYSLTSFFRFRALPIMILGAAGGIRLIFWTLALVMMILSVNDRKKRNRL